MLILDKCYTVSGVERHSSHTKVTIKGVDDSFKFNSGSLCTSIMTLGPMPPIVKYHYQLGDMVVYGRQVYSVTNTNW